jgi:hypothetical protein
VELLHFSHFHQVSLAQWTNRLLPATRGCTLGVQLTLWNWAYLLALSRYKTAFEGFQLTNATN